MENKKRDWLDIVLATMLSVLAVLLMVGMSDLAGYSKVINYTGLVRGGTQTIVKDELAGLADDELSAKVDTYLEELSTGGGPDSITRLNDAAYQEKLLELTSSWSSLKASIAEFRAGRITPGQLSTDSDRIFETADEAVAAAQEADEAIIHHLELLEAALFVLIVVNLVASFVKGLDLSNLRKANSSLSEVAFYDALTGLLNARRCEERLSNPLPISDDVLIACFMFDLNDLKQANDVYGHDEGDRMLVAFASILAKYRLDRMFIGRRGGDEFIAVAVNSRQEEIEIFLARITAAAHKTALPAFPEGISFAYGCALSSNHPGLTVSELMAIADEAMYENKKTIKENRVRRAKERAAAAAVAELAAEEAAAAAAAEQEEAAAAAMAQMDYSEGESCDEDS